MRSLVTRRVQVPVNALCLAFPYQNSMFARNSMRRELEFGLALPVRPNPVASRPVVPTPNVGWLKALRIYDCNLNRTLDVMFTAFEIPISV